MSDTHTILTFGTGSLVVDTGSFSGVPATFICPAKQPGEIGSSAEREGNPKDTLQPGEVVLTFPTETQASRVADALVNTPDTRDALIKEQAAEITRLRAALAEALTKAYDIGFANSGEGYNGEYGADVESDYYISTRTKALEELNSEGAQNDKTL